MMPAFGFRQAARLVLVTACAACGLFENAEAKRLKNAKQLATAGKCEGCDLAGRGFSGDDLQEALLSGANLTGSVLESTNLRGAILDRTSLRNARLRGANLKKAFLKKSDLRGADLREAKLDGAYLYEANLSGANMKGATYAGARFKNTILPDGSLCSQGCEARLAAGESPRRRLMAAAAAGSTDEIQAALAAGAKLNARDSKQGDTPLILAAGNGHLAAVRLLLRKGARIGVRDKSGGDALTAAASEGRNSVIQLLARAGADLNPPSRFWHPLTATVQNGRLDSLKLLIKLGSRSPARDASFESPLHWACRRTEKDSIEMVRLLLGAGAPINARERQENSTPLHACLESGYSPEGRKKIRLLLKHSPDLNARSKEGSILHAAILAGDPVLLKHLVNNGAAVHRAGRDFEARTLLELANSLPEGANKTAIIEFLKKSSAR